MAKRSSRSRARKERQRASARDRADKRGSRGESDLLSIPEGFEQFKLDKEGSKSIELLDYVVGEGNPFADAGMLHYERTYYIHRDVGPEGKWVVCPAKTFGKRCPICEHRTKLGKDPEADEDLVKSLVPKERQIFLIYDHADEEKGAQVWEISYHLFGKQLDDEVRNTDPEDPDEYADVSSWEDGMTVRLGVKEKSFAGNSFYEVASVSFKDRRRALPAEVVEQAESICLDELLKEMSYEDLKSLYYQTNGDDDSSDGGDGDDDEEQPKSGRRSTGKSSRGSTKTKSSRSRGGSTRSKKSKPAFAEGDDVLVDDPQEDGTWTGCVLSVDNDTHATVEDDDGEEWTVALEYLSRPGGDSDDDEQDDKPKSRGKSRSGKSSTRKSQESRGKSSSGRGRGKAKDPEPDDDDDDDDWDDDWD